MQVSKKKIFVICMDILFVVYLFFAFTAFNKPVDLKKVCTKVNVVIADSVTSGFIDAAEVKQQLLAANLYPLNVPVAKISCRQIEEQLQKTAFVKKAECYVNQAGAVNISVTQLLPVVRIKSVNGDDYYIDDKDCEMPNPKSTYTSDLIIATGSISKKYAREYLSPFARALMADDFSKNLVEQIYVTSNQDVEIIPRLGNHVVCLGQLPKAKNKAERVKAINDFTALQMTRLRDFYKYGLSVAGWNKYSFIDLQYDNQIICKKIISKDI